jgi:hypothetical protein
MGRYADTLKLKKRLAAIEAALDIDGDSETSLAEAIAEAIDDAITTAIADGGAIKTWADESYEPKATV